MAIELSRLIKKVEHMDISLLAGKEGLSNIVTWVHMAETIDASDFLDGGQIAITTGIGLTSKGDLLRLLQTFFSKHVSGVILNTGPFIESVPEEVIRFCNDNALPLFVVPWKVHLAEIMRICCFAITKEEQKMLETSAAFKNAIFFPKQEELYVVPLSQRSFRVNWNYSVTVMKLISHADKLEQRLDSLCYALENKIRRDNKHFAIFVNDMEIIIVFAKLSEEELLSEVTDIQACARRMLLVDEKISMGVGRLTKSVRCLYKSYNQARSIERLQSLNKISEEKIFYTKLGIYRLLMGIEDREIMLDYYNHTLKTLTEYDAVNDSDLCKTLRCYLENNGSVKDTADELFVHRNTINYKLNKVEELLGIEMSSLGARTELMIAFNLQDIL